MKFTQTTFWKDLVNENKLPEVPVETYVSDDAIMKMSIALVIVIVVCIIIYFLIKNISE